MVANRAFFRCRRAFDAVAAVGAFPDNLGRAVEDFAFDQRFQQSVVSFFVAFFDGADRSEQEGDFGKAFFVGFSGHAVIHVGPLVVFAGCGVFQVFDRRGNFAAVQQFEPDFGMFFFVVGRLFKFVGNNVVAFFFGF